VNQDCLKLTSYFAEHDKAGGRFLADALLDCYGRHRLATSVLLRGTEGFGSRQRLQTQRLLTLSEDLPMVAVAVDTRQRIQQALDEVTALTGHGLVTLERARLLTGQLDQVRLPQGLGEATKLTVYLGRHQRTPSGRAAFLEVVDLLHRHRVDGATVLLGVDGTAHGVRRRARFFGRNTQVPLMIISVGAGAAIAAALPELGALLERPLLTLERIQVLKRDGHRLAHPEPLPDADPSGRGVWQKLMVYAGEQAQHHGHPLYVQLARRLLQEGAAGATALRGIWGYHGDHPPHGDRLLGLRRRVPVLTVVVDTSTRIRHWFQLVDEVTDQTGLVTCETVPAFRAGDRRGGLWPSTIPAGDPGGPGR
jgi:PII-like signaling protein